MIRDIRRYTGRTPTRLGDGRIVEDTLDPDAHGKRRNPAQIQDLTLAAPDCG